MVLRRAAGRPAGAAVRGLPIHYEDPPAFEVVEAAWREQGRRIRAAVAGERDWTRSITYLSFPDEAGKRYHVTATAGDVVAQLAPARSALEAFAVGEFQ